MFRALAATNDIRTKVWFDFSVFDKASLKKMSRKCHRCDSSPVSECNISARSDGQMGARVVTGQINICAGKCAHGNNLLPPNTINMHKLTITNDRILQHVWHTIDLLDRLPCSAAAYMCI